ncbi:hypothetical protein C8R43DRAFT_959501 [Mycena crocata]|nr:hypothetical protein C8R43DRAFT_959501 [Mycena crocata]
MSLLVGRTVAVFFILHPNVTPTCYPEQRWFSNFRWGELDFCFHLLNLLETSWWKPGNKFRKDWPPPDPSRWQRRVGTLAVHRQRSDTWPPAGYEKSATCRDKVVTSIQKAGFHPIPQWVQHGASSTAGYQLEEETGTRPYRH